MNAKKIKSPVFGKKEEWKAPTSYFYDGYFSEISPINWESCRERFSVKMRKDGFKAFYFCHTAGVGKNVACFIHKTELLLKIPEAKQTTFNETTADRVLRINISKFWMETYIKRSFFTLLPRLGQLYDLEKDNYEESLFEPKRSPASGYKNTIPAIKKFLYGNTVYKDPDPEYSGGSIETAGWCNLLSGSGSVKLIKSLSPEDDSIIVGKIDPERICG